MVVTICRHSIHVTSNKKPVKKETKNKKKQTKYSPRCVSGPLMFVDSDVDVALVFDVSR